MSQTTVDDTAQKERLAYSERQLKDVRELKKEIRFDPNRAELYVEMAEIAESAHDWETAIAAYRQAIRCEPDNADYYDWVGIYCMEAGRHGEAVEAYRAAVRLAPGDSDYHRHLAGALMQSGRHEEAISAYCQLLDFAPADAAPSHARGDEGPGWGEACGYLALMLRRAGLLEETVARLREAVRRRPEIGVFVE